MASHEEKVDWIRRVLGVTIGPDDGLSVWKAARSRAIAQLTALDAAIERSRIPGTERAIVLLRAIRANLPEAPFGKAAIDDLRYYLESDDIIEAAETPNVFGVQLHLRAPLLDALNKIRPSS